MNVPERVKQKLRDLPDSPGCYLFRDARGKIIYVGKAVSLRKRVQSYFRDASLRRGSPKLRGLVRSVQDLDIVVVRNEAEAILTEGRLIKEYRPRYNVTFRDDKRFLLLRADPSEPFPAFKLVRIRKDDSSAYFGPYASSSAARVALDFIEKRFGLRKCTPRIPDEQTHRHCLNDIVRFCSAPCVGKVDRAAYRERFEEACAFLRGERPAILKELRATMDEAAETLDFERAAALRDTWLRLRDAVRQRARLTVSPEARKQERLDGVARLGGILGLAGPAHVIEAFDISNTFGTYAVASMVCAVDGIPQRQRYRRFRIKTVDGIDDPAMIGEVVRRRYTRLQEEGGALPDLVLVDGGVTQLRSARRELQAIGLGALPSAGLAKRLEEIVMDLGKPPVLLSRGDAALKILQHLRDEAHRFALTYHRRLRNERIRESALDDIEGIGAVRKRALLKHFGSIYRLRRADVKAIAKVPGIGPVMAAQIKEQLSGGADAERPEPGGD